MKGLIYRELYLARKKIGVCAVIFILFYGITFLTGLSMRYGNIAKYGSDETISFLLISLPGMLLACVAILIVTGAESIFQVSTTDFKTPWLRYALSTPMGIRRFVGAKYVTYLLLTGAAFLISGAFHVLCMTLCNIALSPRFLLFYLFLLCFTLLCMSFLFPLIFLIQNGDVVSWLASIPLFTGVIIFNVYVIQMDKLGDDVDFIQFLGKYLGFWKTYVKNLTNGLSEFFVWTIPCLIIIMFFIGSYFLSVRLLDRVRYRKGRNKKTGKEGAK